MNPRMIIGWGTLFLILLLFINPLDIEMDAVDDAHESAVHLLDEAHEEHSKEVTLQVRGIKSKIHALGEELHGEVARLRDLKAELASRKAGFWWFLEPAAQASVREAQLRVNQQERAIANTLEQAETQWLALKPIYGVQSKMFVSEALVSISTMFSRTFASIIPSAGFSFLSLLLLGPLAVVLLWTWMEVGLLLLPFLLSMASVWWAFTLPELIASYAPTPNEFVVAYCVCMTGMGLLVYLASWLVTGSSAYSLRIKQD